MAATFWLILPQLSSSRLMLCGTWVKNMLLWNYISRPSTSTSVWGTTTAMPSGRTAALAYGSMAYLLGDLNEHRAAVEMLARAEEIYERLVNDEGHDDLTEALASVYSGKTSLLHDLGDDVDAVKMCERTIASYEQLVNDEGRADLADKLAKAYGTKAIILGQHGEWCASVELFDRAAKIYERLVRAERREDLEEALANTYGNKAVTLRGLGDDPAAADLYQRAIEIREQLLQAERGEVEALAKTYKNKGDFLITGHPPRAFPPGRDPLRIVLESPPIPIRDRNPSVPARVAEVIDTALIERPAMPCKTARDLYQALEAALESAAQNLPGRLNQDTCGQS
jgi:tetratricopeptide (TPR) repeat protein